MTEKERQALKERIASLINHGLDNAETYRTLDKSVCPADLIAVIRDLMDERKGE
jgi:hypothetical protein